MAWQYLPVQEGDPVRAEHINELIDACTERGIGSLPTKVSAGEPIRASTLYDLQDRIASSATQFFVVDDATQQIWRYATYDRSADVYPEWKNFFREILGVGGIIDWPHRPDSNWPIQAAHLNDCYEVLNKFTFKEVQASYPTGGDPADLALRFKWPVQGATTPAEMIATADSMPWSYFHSIPGNYSYLHLAATADGAGGWIQQMHRWYYVFSANTFGPAFFMVSGNSGRTVEHVWPYDNEILRGPRSVNCTVRKIDGNPPPIQDWDTVLALEEAFQYTITPEMNGAGVGPWLVVRYDDPPSSAHYYFVVDDAELASEGGILDVNWEPDPPDGVTHVTEGIDQWCCMVVREIVCEKSLQA